MNSRVKDVSLLDRSLRRALRRQVEQLGAEPRPDLRRRILQQAAARGAGPRWAAFLDGLYPAPAAPGRILTFGWQELAFMQALRSNCMFGSLSGSLR